MPVHDWTRVDAGVFHDFHMTWIGQIRTALNTGLLPEGYYALAEQTAGQIGPDVLTLQQRRVVIRHKSNDRLVAIVEIVSSGNKSSQAEFRRFVQKAVAILKEGIQLLVVDLFPPTSRDPSGMHGAIWSELGEEEYQLPPDQPLTLAAYSVSDDITAYVEPLAVRDALPVMPLFLGDDQYVDVPLEETYLAAWKGVPRHLQEVLERAPGVHP